MQVLEGADHHVAYALDRGAHLHAGHVEHGLLGLIEELLGVAVVCVAFRGDAVAGDDEPPHQRLLANDVRVSARVLERRDGVREREQVVVSAHRLQLVGARQVLAQGHRIDRRACPMQLERSLVDAPVAFAVEVLRLDDLEHGVDHDIVQQDASEHGSFGFERMRRNAFDAIHTTLSGSNDVLLIVGACKMQNNRTRCVASALNFCGAAVDKARARPQAIDIHARVLTVST
jgi:hypothetical protein